MQAQVVESPGVLALKTVDLPVIGAGEILVKVHAVSLNPTDWKHLYYVSVPGSYLGCDFSGEVTEVAEGVTNVKVGERVAGFVHGGLIGSGSFAQYTKTSAELVWKVSSNISYEEAAALGGVGPHTAFQALYLSQKLARPDAPITTGEPFLVYGGSTSVGMYAIQLAKLGGYTVIATSSPSNFELLKSLGATQVFDYKNPSTPTEIHTAYPTLSKALDCISEKGTTALVAQSIGSGKSGKITTLLPVSPDQLGGVQDVTSEMTLAYVLIGKEFTMMGNTFPADLDAKNQLATWLKYVPTLIESGKLKANPLMKQSGGLATINEGLEILKNGKNSAQKVVYSF